MSDAGPADPGQPTPPPPGGYGPGGYGAPPGPGPSGYGPSGYGPGGYGYPPGAYGAPAYGGYGYPVAPKTNNLAVVALVCGLASFVVCPLIGIAGIVTGVQARRQIAQSAGAEKGDGMALAGIITGAIGLGLIVLVVIGFLLLAAVAGTHAGTGGALAVR